MGMFDYVKVDVALPDGWVPPSGDLMQTKDFDSTMTTVWIKADGTIWFDEAAHWYERDDVEAEWKQMDFHGWFEFYGNEDPANHKGGSSFRDGKRFDLNGNPLPPLIWHEYRAKFTDGVLVEIRQVERNL